MHYIKPETEMSELLNSNVFLADSLTQDGEIPTLGDPSDWSEIW